MRRAEWDPQRPSILLAHQPANLAVAEEEGISLQLSGHTHGGQFWPWIYFVSRIYGRFAYGLSRLGKLQVFTSNGVGTWGPSGAGGYQIRDRAPAIRAGDRLDAGPRGPQNRENRQDFSPRSGLAWYQ
ncbi:MAG: hypothetical protein WDN28_04830 [Chthoniobacter sp.]